MANGLLAVDICNTLADVNSQIAKALGPNPNPSVYFHPGVYPGFFEENPWVYKKAPPISGAAEVLQHLNQYWDIVYLTARPEWAKAITADWLKKWGFPTCEIVCTKNKGAEAKSLSVAMAIEDAPHEIKALEKAKIPVLVHAQPYNYGLGVTRFSWDLFLEEQTRECYTRAI